MKRKFNNRNKKVIIPFLIVTIIILSISIANKITEPKGHFHPDYPKKDISKILNKDFFTEEDYRDLFYQTGLAKVGIDDILKDKDGKEKILSFQKDFFAEPNIDRSRSALVVNHESLVNDEGRLTYGFNLAPYKNGYVLISKSTYTLGWRHGHGGLVTDAGNQETLEAVLLGTNSSLQNINRWRTFPSFMMLKLKDVSQDKLDEIADFAKDYLHDIPYGLTVGITSKKNPEPDKIKSTHCSHIVWYPFMQFGYDIDSNGSIIVTPKDIAKSDLFEVVQIYGFDPEEIWPNPNNKQ